MKNAIFFILAFIQLNNLLGAQEVAGDKVTGSWSGKIELPAMQLELIFNISVSKSGDFTTTLDVPAQGARDLPVDETILTPDSLLLSVAMIFGNFKGEFRNDTTIAGTWNQNGMNLPLVLVKSESLPELNRPQTPQKPFPYLEEEVTYENTTDNIKLAGTLTIPKDAESCPAVILITGSGPQDRDETIFGHRPFFVIADYLTRNGIAVLRVDDRGVGGSEGNISDATSKDFVNDVIAGLEFLRKKPQIDAENIGLIGHSEGGIIAPMAANQSGDIAFVVLLAGPGIVGEQIVYEQGELMNKAAGMTDEQVQQNRKQQEALFNIVLNEKDTTVRLDRLRRTLTNGMYPMLKDDQKLAVDAQVNAINTRWFRFFLTYDPYPALTQLKIPVLALIGEKDLQVPAGPNLAAIEKALTEGGNPHFKTLKMEGLNHLFQTCKTGSVEEYGQIEETISPRVLEIMNDWIWQVAN